MQIIKKLSLVYISVFFYTIVIQSGMFLFDLPLTPISLYLAFLVTILVDYLWNKKLDRNLVYACLILVVLMLVGSLYYSHFNETTYDGAFYHGNAMVNMLKGWNPHLQAGMHKITKVTIWSDFYPKATWIFGAVLIKQFHHLSVPMMIPTLFAMASSFYTCQFVYKKTRNLVVSSMLALVVFVNPITIQQFQTYYVDGILGNVLLMLILFGLEAIDHYDLKQNYYILLISVILINIKFTGFGFAGIINFAIWLYFLLKNRKAAITYTLFGIVMLAIAIGIVGYSPYFYNLTTGKHIFFPVAGKEAIDVINYLIPEQLFGKNPIYKLYYSLFQGKGLLKNLFDVSVNRYYFYDEQIGAFGTFFFRLAVLSGMGYLIYLKKAFQEKTYHLGYLLVFIGFVVTILINYKHIWWFRYAPQIWLFLPLGMYYLFLHPKGKYVAYVMLVVILFQNALMYSHTLRINIDKSNSIMSFYRKYQNKTIDITIKNFDDTEIYWFNTYEAYRGKQFHVDIHEILHEGAYSDECYHMHVYKVCVVRELKN